MRRHVAFGRHFSRLHLNRRARCGEIQSDATVWVHVEEKLQRPRAQLLPLYQILESGTADTKARRDEFLKWWRQTPYQSCHQRINMFFYSSFLVIEETITKDKFSLEGWLLAMCHDSALDLRCMQASFLSFLHPRSCCALAEHRDHVTNNCVVKDVPRAVFKSSLTEDASFLYRGFVGKQGSDSTAVSGSL